MKNSFKNLISFILNNITPTVNIGGIILMYHSIGDNKVLFTVSERDFEWQIKFLINNNFSFLKVSELTDKLLKRESILKTICITFDDGYQDNADIVFPILKKYNIPITIFITTGMIGNTRTISGGFTLPIMDTDTIKKLSESGLIECMPHGHIHKKLSKLSDQDAEIEISESKKIIEYITSKSASCYAYAYGNYSENTLNIIESLGFKSALTVKEGFINKDSKILELPRLTVDSYTTRNIFIFKIKRLPYYLSIKNFFK